MSEAYPDLKANQNMMQLTEELTSTENNVAFARQAYNDAVMVYNTKRETFPTAIIADSFDFTAAQLFEIEEPAQREAPKVRSSRNPYRRASVSDVISVRTDGFFHPAGTSAGRRRNCSSSILSWLWPGSRSRSTPWLSRSASTPLEIGPSASTSGSRNCWDSSPPESGRW